MSLYMEPLNGDHPWDSYIFFLIVKWSYCLISVEFQQLLYNSAVCKNPRLSIADAFLFWFQAGTNPLTPISPGERDSENVSVGSVSNSDSGRGHSSEEGEACRHSIKTCLDTEDSNKTQIS